MGRRRYRWLTPEAIDRIWVRLRAGQAVKPTAVELGLATGTVRAYLVRCGGIRPEPRQRAAGQLTMAEREEISRGRAAGQSIRAIAATLGRAPSTVSQEVNVNGGARRYRAASADQAAWARATRPKRCKLADNPVLRDIVEEKLQSIYRTLYVQSGAALRTELTRYLRTGRVLRRPKGVRLPEWPWWQTEHAAHLRATT